jgi:3-deoxy-D-manno-octulosonic-acid transferase
MIFIYTFFIRCYHLFIAVISPFHNKAKLFTVGRKNQFERIKNQLTPKEKNIWFHCSSLGEFEQGRPLIEKIKTQYPGYKIVLTFFSPSGYEQRKNHGFADYVYYLPADTPKNAKEFLKLINPAFVVFIKYEFWLNFLNQLHKNNTPVFLVSAVFRENQHFFKWYGKLFKETLFHYETIFVQNKQSVDLLLKHGITKVILAGDTRFDRVIEIARYPKRFKEIETLCKGKKVIVSGSTWPEDEEFILDAYHELKRKNNDLILIIAPHEISEKNTLHICDKSSRFNAGYKIQLFTKGIKNEPTDILIIDTIGVLSSIYQYGDIACIGGGFGSGIHNIAEALVYGLPVYFGPNYKKFNEAIESIENKFGFTYIYSNELTEGISSLINDSEKLNQLKQNSKEYILNNAGSAEKIIGYFEKNGFLNY